MNKMSLITLAVSMAVLGGCAREGQADSDNIRIHFIQMYKYEGGIGVAGDEEVSVRDNKASVTSFVVGGSRIVISHPWASEGKSLSIKVKDDKDVSGMDYEAVDLSAKTKLFYCEKYSLLIIFPDRL